MRGIKRSTIGMAFILATSVALLSGCNDKKDDQSQGESGFPRGKTLYLGGSQWGDPSSFNPLQDWPAWPVNDKFDLMYEPLLAYNTQSGQFEPILASLISQNTDSVVVQLNPAAKWSDGQPVTSTDVKFIYQLGKRFKSAPTGYALDFISDIKVDTVTVNGVKAEQLVFVVNKAGRNNPLVIMDLLQGIRILPSHVFEAKLASFKDSSDPLSQVQKLKFDSIPVVSGPYTLSTYSNEKIVLKRRDDYWGNAALYAGKMPTPEYIIHPIFKSNDHFALALQKGELDASQTFIPRIWLKSGDGVHTWYSKEPYYIPGAIPMLFINNTKAPLNDKNFRRAMGFALDYKAIKDLAVSGYSPDIKPGIIMPVGPEAKYYNDEDAKQYGVSFDLEKAKKQLTDAGYKSIFKADGTLDSMVDAKGKRVPTLYIKCPAGWSDWEAIVKIAVKGLRTAGIDVREGFVDASLYWQALPTGDWDLILHKPASSVTPSLPWSRFEAVMSSRNWSKIGEKMNENQGRFNNPKAKDYDPKVDSLIKVIPTISDEAAKVKAYRDLNILFMQEQPVLPLCYLPEQFYEYSDRHWTGWPNETNASAPPQLPWVGAGIKTLWHLQSVK